MASCQNGTCGAAVPCTVATPCQVQICYQAFPACYARTDFIAPQGTLPANVGAVIGYKTAQGMAGGNVYEDMTITPEVMDLDIALGSQVVNSPAPDPSPIMVGQQVQLAPSPAASNVQWYFDTTQDTVGDYTLKDSVAPGGAATAIQAVPSPSPAPTATSPITFYWISGGGKHLYAVVTYPNVIGQLPADVYYTVSTPAPTVTASPISSVTLAAAYPSVGTNGEPNCNDQSSVAIALGNPCDLTKGSPKKRNRSGINWTYSVAAPSYGSGLIGMVQLVNNISGVANGTPSPNPNSYSSSGLDDNFPYVSAVQTGTKWQGNDSPADVLDTPPPCASVTYSGSFTDYFMYQPAVTQTRKGSRLWVTLGVMNWMFSGTAADDANSWTLTGHTDPVPTYKESQALPEWSQIRVPGSIQC